MPSPPSESALMTRKYPDPESESPAAQNVAESAWISRQVRAMALAWSRGEHVRVEEVLARHPEIADETAIRLIYEEVCLRREAGQDVATNEAVSRFPRWQDELEVLLGCDRLLRPFCRAAMFPDAGEDLGPFRLLAEIGRGAAGKTYIAAEPALGNRLVVLKVITADHDEHLSLARLQHTHIIPLFSEQNFPERGLRALCMPYLAGASLARVLEGVAHIAPQERRGQHLLDALDRLRTVHSKPPTADGPYRRYLGQASYVQAICWIAACLADALQSAHAHGLIHMDVKPSNVLMAGDGLPMLLDFHLAHRPIAKGEEIADRLGGTPGWMAPEHCAALDAVSQGKPVSQPIDGRADLYALGLLLREALAGAGLAQGTVVGEPWRGRNCQVTVGLADIVDRCLATRPCDRYHDAGALADDLRRHLGELPLRGVPNRSLIESWRKWRRRQPGAITRVMAWLGTCAALLAVLGLGEAYYSQRVREIETAVEAGRQLRADGRFPEAIHTLGRGLQVALAVPGVENLRRSLRDQLILAQRAQKAAGLHELAELVRFRHSIDLPAAEEARALIGHIRSVWNECDLLLGRNTGALDSKSEQVIRTDLLDLAITSAELQMGLASRARPDTAHQEALQLLDRANACCGPSARLERLRRSAASLPLEVGSADFQGSSASSALDHYDLGRAHLRADRFREAALEFQQVLDRRPHDFWPNFYQGLCAYRLRQFHEAQAAFRTCIALAPDSAECYFNRARVSEALGQRDQALRDYGRALEFDPGLTAASINRGILAYQSDSNEAAIADFHQAARSAADSRTLGLIHYNLALAYLAQGDRASAIKSTREAIARGHDPARRLSDRLDCKP